MSKVAIFLIPLGILSAFTALKTRPRPDHNFMIGEDKKSQIIFYKVKSKTKRYTKLTDSPVYSESQDNIIKAPMYLRTPASLQKKESLK
jgi:hypothetical protein